MTSSTGWEAPAFRPLSYPRYGSVVSPVTTDPFLQGAGPAECSTSRELSVLPAFIHDVNGYYRDLGVRTHATRKEMRLAYYERDGQTSERLTYVLKQLLNPVVRREYDLLPLGSIYVDKYVEEAMRRKAMAEHARRMRERREQGMVVNDGVERESLRDVYARMGMPISFEDDDTPEDVLDATPEVAQDRPHPAKMFRYAYYLWRTRLRGPQDLEALMEWQELLISAFAERGVRTRIAVGLHGGMASRWALARVGFREVIFLHHLETPTAELAERAAAEWINQHPFA